MSWRMDETYIKVRGQWKYLYRTVDHDGHPGWHRDDAHDQERTARQAQSPSFVRSTPVLLAGLLIVGTLRGSLNLSRYCDRTLCRHRAE